jgi:hypothetical protein
LYVLFIICASRKDPDKNRSSASICVSHTLPISLNLLHVLNKIFNDSRITNSALWHTRWFQFLHRQLPLPMQQYSTCIWCVHISRKCMIRYAKACSIYGQFLIRGNLFTNKFRSKEFLQSHLQAAFSKFYGRKNDQACPYNLHLSHMLFFILNLSRFETLIWNTVRTIYVIWKWGSRGVVTGQQGICSFLNTWYVCPFTDLHFLQNL